MQQLSYRNLGSSGLMVSPVGLGTMTFGDRTDEEGARRIFDAAIRSGVNLIDTADTYAGGRSEEIVGRLIAADRDYFVLSTKAANPNGVGPNRRGLSRKWLLESVRGSLRRLNVEYIDILYLHKDDGCTPLRETAHALMDLIRNGLVRYFGTSNFRPSRIAELCFLCDQIGTGRPIVNQCVYHVLNRTAEMDELPCAASLGLGVVPYSPLARGVLTGKYSDQLGAPDGSRVAIGNRRILETEYHPDNLKAVASLSKHAHKRGVSLATFAGAWLLANKNVSSILAGPRTVDQWQDYVAATELNWTDEDEEAVDLLVRPGTTCIPWFTDPAYPPTGRALRPGLR